MIKYFAIIFVWLLIFGSLLPAKLLAQNTMKRAAFYSQSDLGDLAWLPGVTNKKKAVISDKYVNLSGVNCVVLPQTSNYFVMNHSTSDFSGQAFAAIRVISRFSSTPRNAVHWQRSGSWFEDGEKTATMRSRTSPSLSISQMEFSKAHAVESGESREWIQENSASFHANLALGLRPPFNKGTDSWSHASTFGDASFPTALTDRDQVSYRNKRFTFLDGVVTRSPVSFKLSKNASRHQTILVDVPNYLPIVERKILEIRYGNKFGSC